MNNNLYYNEIPQSYYHSNKPGHMVASHMSQPIPNQGTDDERFGFLGPFLLGGLTGGLVAPFFYGGRYTNYYPPTPYPYYPPAPYPYSFRPYY